MRFSPYFSSLYVMAFSLILGTSQLHAQAATPVIVKAVQMQNFADTIEALGTLKARESVDLTAAVTDIVTKVNFTDNQTVAAGDVLIEMDANEERAQLAEVESNRLEAQRQVNRLTPLVQQGAASSAALDTSRRDLAGARAQLEAVQSRIDQRVIKAPFAGTLGLRNISVGALVQPGTLITTIDDTSVMKLDFSVPEVFLSTLKRGVQIFATTEAYPSQRFAGRIDSVDSRIDPITRSIEARALIDNAEQLLKPGLLMQVDLEKNPRQAVTIPEEALLSKGPDHFVFVVNTAEDAATAERRQISIGSRRFGDVEVTGGLAVGEQIITQGIIRVRPGATVSITTIETGNETLGELLDTSLTNQSEARN